MQRDLNWDGCLAVRDLGGLATPEGPTAARVFVRGDNARNLSPCGWSAAWDYGVRAVLDLRSAAECRADPAIPAEMTYRRVSLFAHFDEDEAYRADLLARVADLPIAAKYRALYGEALELDRARIAEAFAGLAGSPAAVFFHCVGGKDRTGLLAALLLRLVGVAMHDVESDFVQTEARSRAVTQSPHIDQSAPAGLMTDLISDLETQNGSVARYLLAAGVTHEQLSVITRRFVNGAREQD